MAKKRNPRTGRKTEYLGHRVKDTRKPGLDNLSEVKGIIKKILEDHRKRRINYRTAVSRLNLLKLITKKDEDFKRKGLRRKAWKLIEEGREKLKRLRSSA